MQRLLKSRVQPWRTIYVGSGGFYRSWPWVRAFTVWRKKIKIDPLAQQAMDSPGFREALRQQSPELLSLVEVTGSQLGLPRRFPYSEIVMAAGMRGLQCCPPEVGPAIVEQCLALHGDFMVAMDPLDVMGRPVIFKIYRSPGFSPLIRTVCVKPGNLCNINDRFVFAQPTELIS